MRERYPEEQTVWRLWGGFAHGQVRLLGWDVDVYTTPRPLPEVKLDSRVRGSIMDTAPVILETYRRTVVNVGGREITIGVADGCDPLPLRGVAFHRFIAGLAVDPPKQRRKAHARPIR